MNLAKSTQRFLRCADLSSSHRFGIAGVPYDGATTNRTGSRFGPREIRNASEMLCDGLHPHFERAGEQLFKHLGDAGDLEDAALRSSLSLMRTKMASVVPELIKNHHMIWLGGDHSITLPLLRCYNKQFGQLAVVHFDAHCDTWSDHFGEPSGHGTWV
jgi:agmatinase